jgi:hypothetical protein
MFKITSLIIVYSHIILLYIELNIYILKVGNRIHTFRARNSHDFFNRVRWNMFLWRRLKAGVGICESSSIGSFFYSMALFIVGGDFLAIKIFHETTEIKVYVSSYLWNLVLCNVVFILWIFCADPCVKAMLSPFNIFPRKHDSIDKKSTL